MTRTSFSGKFVSLDVAHTNGEKKFIWRIIRTLSTGNESVSALQEKVSSFK
ncbi:hypothetical protein STEG23_011351, partial [Scotinomys teguina]